MRSNRRFRGIATLTCLTTICGAVGAAEQKEFDISTNDATAALTKFGQQAGQELLFDYERVRGRTTNAVKGRYEPPAALNLMLDGSGLRTSVAGDGVLVIEDSGVAATTSVGGAPDSRRERSAPPGAAARQSQPLRLAQAGGPPQSARAQGAQGADAGRLELETIVVTGSRIPVTGQSAPMPMVVIDRERIEATGQDNIADVMLSLPSVGVGVGVQNTRNSTSFGAGLNLVNLRRLGANRTLVLVNGRRQVSGAPLSAAVDLNTIPSPLVERTEIVQSPTAW